jgi:predicted O-linked N-acetylglucosamine transferase (SPINDLY family)
MPNSQWCYAPVYNVQPAIETRRASPRALRLASFNQYAKISDACLDLWCSVLAELPGAELHALDVPEGKTREAFRLRFAQRGIDPDRVVIHGRKPILDYFAAIASVDVALDTFPYNGATTTLDTLWMGVPVVALRGDRGISRSSYSIMRSLGMSELIAADPEDYVRCNVDLVRDVRRRAELRLGLRSRLESSPLMDAAAFARDLETAFRQMWRDWCNQQASRRGPA